MKKALLIVNLGTPDKPTYFSVLKELKIKTIFIPLIKKKSSTIMLSA